MMRSPDRSRPAALVALERLNARAERLLRDELRHGCADRVVQCGLEGFREHWHVELGRSGASSGDVGPAKAAIAALRGSQAWSQAERAPRLRAALATLSPGDQPGTANGRPTAPSGPTVPSATAATQP